MEGHKILRENQFVLLPIEISCEKINRGYRIFTNCPMDDSTKCPVIKEKEIPFSVHPMLRPFDKFLLYGDPNIGDVTHIFISYPKLNRPAIVCSIVNTKIRILKRRILILPAWGEGIMKPLLKSGTDQKGYPIAHITIDENQNGDISIHYSGPPGRKGKKEKVYPKATPLLKSDNGIHVGTLGVNNIKNLDPLCIVYRDLDYNKLPRKTLREVEEILKRALSRAHPLFRLPPESSWDEDRHLEVSFALIGNKLDNIVYPKDEIHRHEEAAVEQLNRVPIDEDRSLLITFTMCPGKLKNDFQWKLRRK